jgi:hypothetical protein
MNILNFPDPRSPFLNILTEYLPAFMLVTAILGLLLAIAIDRPDFVIRAWVVVVPIILFYIFHAKFRGVYLNGVENRAFFPYSQRSLSKIFCILFILSYILLVLNLDRPWYYFPVVIAMYAVILLQILSEGTSETLVIAELILANVNLAFGVVLKYPYYFGYTDIFRHEFMTRVTYLSHHIIPGDLAYDYSNFPLFHISGAMNTYLLGLDIKTSMFLTNSIAFAFLALFIFVLFRKTIPNRRVLLLTCLVFSLLTEVVTNSMYVITRTMAFIGFILLLSVFYLSYKQENKIVFYAISLIFGLYIILVHQVSITQFVILWGILVVCEWLGRSERYYVKNDFLIFIVVLFMSYWYLSPAYEFVQRLVLSRVAEIHLQALVMSSTIAVGNQFSYLFEHIDTSIIIFFIFLGIEYLLLVRKQGYGVVFALFGLAAAVFYIPNPVQTLYDVMVLFRTDRIFLFICPFLALLIAWGFYVLLSVLVARRASRTYYGAVALGILVSLAFFSICYHNAQDSDSFPWQYPHKHFDGIEMDGLTYAVGNLPHGSYIISDYDSQRFLNIPKFNGSDALDLPYFRSYVINSRQLAQGNVKYIVYREEEFLRYGLIFQSEKGDMNYFYLSTGDNMMGLTSYLDRKQKIFSNRGVSIYLDNIHPGA